MGRLIVSAAAHAQPGRFRFQHVAGTFHATSSNCRSTRGPLLSTWFAQPALLGAAARHLRTASIRLGQEARAKRPSMSRAPQSGSKSASTKPRAGFAGSVLTTGAPLVPPRLTTQVSSGLTALGLPTPLTSVDQPPDPGSDPTDEFRVRRNPPLAGPQTSPATDNSGVKLAEPSHPDASRALLGPCEARHEKPARQHCPRSLREPN